MIYCLIKVFAGQAVNKFSHHMSRLSAVLLDKWSKGKKNLNLQNLLNKCNDELLINLIKLQLK